MEISKKISKLFIKSDFAIKNSIKKINSSDDLFDLGMDSISFVMFLVTLENEFNITFDMEELDFDKISTLDHIVEICEKKIKE